MNTAPPDDAARVAERRRVWRQVRRLLVVRLDNLGDVLMTTPAIAALRAGMPGAQITLLGSATGAAAAPLLPDIDDAIAFDAPWVAGPGARGVVDAVGDETLRRVVRRLLDGGFDAAVIFTVCTQSALPAALLCRMAGIGLRLAHSRENPYGLLSDWVRDSEVVGDGMRHEVQRQLALVASVGLSPPDTRLRLQVGPAARRRAQQRLREAGLRDGQPYVVVHPGASAASRRWPAERFGAAASRIARESGLAIVYTGSGDEAAAVRQAREAMPGASIAFDAPLALEELAALIAGARLLLTNNTGPAHIAASTGTPVVDLYALTNPQHTPWRVPSRVLYQDVDCRHCLKSVCPAVHHACLLGVSVDDAVRAALELLDETEPEVIGMPPVARTAFTSSQVHG